ncbi:MAG: hypothetical protein AB1634_06860 [Thermodesulfobacteriota bacterium]
MADQDSAPLDISAQVLQVARRSNVLVRSFGSLDADTRQLFAQERRRAILLVHSHYYEREINPVPPHRLDIFDASLCRLVHKGQGVLVALPVGAVRYVLQCVVEEVFMDRFRLRSRDPRRYRRVRPAGDPAVRLYQVPEVFSFMVERKTLAVRRTVQAEADSLTVRDEALERSSQGPAPLGDRLFSLPLGIGSVKDLSLGGALVQVAAELGEDLSDRLMLADLHLPGPSAGFLAAQVLAVVRVVEPASPGTRLHLMFLEPLPPTAEGFLAPADPPDA